MTLARSLSIITLMSMRKNNMVLLHENPQLSFADCLEF